MTYTANDEYRGKGKGGSDRGGGRDRGCGIGGELKRRIVGKLLGDTCEGNGGRGGGQGARGTVGGARSGWGGHAATTERCTAASQAVLRVYGRADRVGFPKEGKTQSATTGGVRERGSVAHGWVVAVG